MTEFLPQSSRVYLPEAQAPAVQSVGSRMGNHTPQVLAPAAIAFAWQQGDDSPHTGTGRGRSWVARAGDYTGSLSTTRHDAVAQEAAVRRLTPTECERLQAFPDGWTCLCGVEPYSTAGCRCPDGSRYAALGNAVTVSVCQWLGRRLLAAHEFPDCPS